MWRVCFPINMPNVSFGRLLQITRSCSKRATIGDTVVSHIRFPPFFSRVVGLIWGCPLVHGGPWWNTCGSGVFGVSCRRPSPPPDSLPLPPYPTPHLPQSSAIPSLSSRLHTKPCQFSFFEMHHIQSHQIWTNVHA